jgi:hypothetical protein
MAVRVERAYSVGDDVLVVEGTIDGIVGPVLDDSGRPLMDEDGSALVGPRALRAQGWVSATTNHYDAKSYDKAGNLKDGAEPREMKASEVKRYCERLLVEQNPVTAPTPDAAEVTYLIGSAPS